MAIYGEHSKREIKCDWPSEQSWIDVGRGLGALVELCESMQMDALIEIEPDYDGRRMIHFKAKERAKK